VAAVNDGSGERRWSLLAVVTGGALLALGFSSVGWAGGPQPQPASSSTTVAPAPDTKLMSFNVCGGACRHGEVTTTARFVAEAVRHRDVQVVLLQELCYSQFRRVRALLAERGFSGRFEAQSQSPACASDDSRHGTGFGVAVLVRGHLTRSEAGHLPVFARFTELAETRVRNPEIGNRRAYEVTALPDRGGHRLTPSVLTPSVLTVGVPVPGAVSRGGG
jgi:hypothetical protein